MIENELLLLGLLKEGPKHGYDIKIKIKEILALFSGIELKSIYYPLRILEKKGLVVKHLSKAGRRPERKVYALTAKGNTHFQGLLKQSLLNFKRPQFSLDLSLYFLRFIKPEVARRRLRARMMLLKRLSAGMRQTVNSLKNKKSASLVHILEHDLQMVETEFKFLSSMLEKTA